jgi:ATP-dependent DNA ligase
LRTPDPMLASAMTNPVTGAKFDARFATGYALETKYDGWRVMVDKTDDLTTMWSRPRAGGAPKLQAIPAHIAAQLVHLGNGLYDAELVVPGGKSWDVARLENHDKLVLVIFDLLYRGDDKITGRPYTERRLALLYELMKLPEGQTAISTTESVTPPTWATVQAIWAEGGEGAILKRVDSIYREGARSEAWIKVKELHHTVMTVEDFEEGKSGPYSAFTLRDDVAKDRTNLVTTVKVLFAKERADIAKDPSKYRGRKLVVSYQLRTPAGKWRHIQQDHWASDAEVAACAAGEVTCS